MPSRWAKQPNMPRSGAEFVQLLGTNAEVTTRGMSLVVPD